LIFLLGPGGASEMKSQNRHIGKYFMLLLLLVLPMGGLMGSPIKRHLSRENNATSKN
jgi:hypothetical protein